MQNKTRETGGGPATGLANDFVSWLSQGLNTGTFGTGTPAGQDAVGSTMGMSSILNDILSGGAGVMGGNMKDMMNKESERQAMQLRARFGVGGGTAFGTPGQYAESLFRSEQAPKMTAAIGGLQQNALAMLLPMFANMSSKGISQRSNVVEPSGWASAMAIAAPLIGTGLGMMAGGPGGAAAGAQMGAGVGSAMRPSVGAGMNPGMDWGMQTPYTPTQSQSPWTSWVPTIGMGGF